MKTKFFCHYGELHKCLDKLEFDLNQFEAGHDVESVQTTIVNGTHSDDYYVVLTVRYLPGLEQM